MILLNWEILSDLHHSFPEPKRPDITGKSEGLTNNLVHWERELMTRLLKFCFIQSTFSRKESKNPLHV